MRTCHTRADAAAQALIVAIGRQPVKGDAKLGFDSDKAATRVYRPVRTVSCVPAIALC